MNKAAGGFTLIEVLLAISLLALLLLLVASAITAARHALTTSEGFAAQLDEVRTAQVFLRREIQQILPVALQGQREGVPSVFLGEPTEMRYIASLPSHQGGGLYMQTVGLGNTTAQPWLQVSFTRITGPGVSRPWGEPQRLLRRVRQLRLTYQGLDPEGHPTTWLPRWPWPERLPRQVAVRVDSQGPILWPPLQVALRLEPQNIATGAQ